MEMSQRLVSEYLPSATKTVIEYDCMPTFANILTARIVDMDENRVVKSFGIKQGIELEILYYKKISVAITAYDSLEDIKKVDSNSAKAIRTLLYATIAATFISNEEKMHQGSQILNKN